MSKSYAIQARELNDAVFEPTPIAAGKKDPFPHIPQGLKDTPRWLIWAEKIEGDKTKKIPVDDAGKYVAGKDPENWLAYAKAISKSSKIGFQFSDEDKYCGVDLDKCHVPDTGQVEEWAEDIIGAFGSYTELSPSRTGFHIICETDIDHTGVNSGKVELYSKERFFTFTGEKYDYDDITNCTEEYKTLLLEHKKSDSTDVKSDHIKLDDRKLLQEDKNLCNRIESSKQRNKFKELFEGKFPAYDSQSDADMALCNILAFWTAKNSEQMCRIFSASALGDRDKWKKREDYRKRTIARAIADCKETYTPPGEKEAVKATFKFIMAGDIIAAAQPTEWLIKGILMKDALSELFGPSGSYKSFLALAWALSVATGTKWFGHNVIQAPVLMVIGEGHNGYAKRIAAWCKDASIDSKKLPLAVSEMPAQMLDDNSAYAVAEAIQLFSKQHGEVGLVCFDTVARNFGAGNENSTEDMTRFIYNLDRFVGKGRNRLLVHHTGHNNTERARGSSVLKAAVDVEYRMVKGENQITLSNTKMKDDPAFSDMYFKPEQIIVGGNFGNLESSVILTSTKKVKTVLESAIFFLKQNDNAPKEKMVSYLEQCDHSGDAIRKMLDRERGNHSSKKRIYTKENRYSLHSF